MNTYNPLDHSSQTIFRLSILLILLSTLAVLFALAGPDPEAAAAAEPPRAVSANAGVFNGNSAVVTTTVAAHDPGGKSTNQTSLAEINGYPAISYYDSVVSSLRFVRAHDADGTSWGDPITVDPNPNTGFTSHLLEVNGRPAIVYFDATNTALNYVRANDASGSSWGTPQQLDGESNYAGAYLSFAIIGGHPAVAYQESTANELRFVRANDSSGDSWSAPVTVDSDGFIQYGATLAEINGRPGISYFEFGAKEIRYVRASDAAGTSWQTPVSIATQSPYNSNKRTLAEVNGRPAILYFGPNKLMFVRADDANGDSWPVATPIDADGDILGDYSAMILADDAPVIAFQNSSGGSLTAVRAADRNGDNWLSPMHFDAGYVIGVSMAIINGRPAIAYNRPEGTLFFKPASNSSGTTWHDSRAVTGGSVGSGTSIMLVDGRPAVSYIDHGLDALRFIRATDELGTSWPEPQRIDTAGPVAGRTALDHVNGRPAIAYLSEEDRHIHLIRAADAAGTSWNTPVTVVEDMNTTSSPVMIQVTDHPALVFTDYDRQALYYIRANDPNGENWGSPITVTTFLDDAPSDFDIAIVNNRPAIAFQNSGTGDLDFVRAADADGSSWGPSVTVVAADFSQGDDYVADELSMIIVNGRPAISFTREKDPVDNILQYVRAADQFGTNWGVPIDIDLTEYAGEENVLGIVNGRPVVAYKGATGQLLLRYALDRDGATWGAAVTVDDLNDEMGNDSDLVVVEDTVIVSHRDGRNNHLRVGVVQPAVSFVEAEVTQLEGDLSGLTMPFILQRHPHASGNIVLNYEVAGRGDAPAEADDFGGTWPSGVITIPAAAASYTVEIPLLGDLIHEEDDQFAVILSVNGVTAELTTAFGTISNDDPTAPDLYLPFIQR